MKHFIMIIMFALMSLVGGSAYAAEADANKSESAVVEGVSTVYNDTKNVVSTIYGDSKDLIKGAYPEVKEAVIAIGSAIGCATEHVYGVLVKKFIVEGVNLLFWGIVGIAIFIFGFVKMNKLTGSLKIFDWHIVIPAIYMLIGVIILINVDFHQMLMGLINPEWGAINYILDYTKEMIR